MRTIFDVVAQMKTLRILLDMNTSTRIMVIQQIRRKEITDEVRVQLAHCEMISADLAECPNRYDSLQALAEKIVMSQRECERVKKREWLEQIQMSKTYEWRVENGKAAIEAEHVRNLCDGFKNTQTMYFWQNMMLSAFPEIAIPFVGNYACSAEVECLHLLCEELGVEYLEEYRTFMEFVTAYSKMDDSMSLYPFISHYCKEKCDVIDNMADIIQINRETWYNWKDLWEEAKGKDFSAGAPKLRLQREHLLCLSKALDLSDKECEKLLTIAGYRITTADEQKDISEATSNCKTDEERRKSAIAALLKRLAQRKWG